MKLLSRNIVAGVVTTIFLAMGTRSSQGATRTWIGAGLDNKWSTGSNWSPSGAPQDGDTVVFATGALQKANVNDLVNRRLFEVQFSGASGGFTISGNAIRLDNDISASHNAGLNRFLPDIQFTSGGGVFYVLSGGTLEIGGTVTISANQQLIAYPYTTNLTISGSIQGNGDLAKFGPANLYLTGNGANTYSGFTLVQEGQLHLAKPSAAVAISPNVRIGDNTSVYASMYDDDAGQYPSSMSMVVSSNGFWGITNGATVNSLTIRGGGIGGTGLLNLLCDVYVYYSGTSQYYVEESSIDCPIYLGTQDRTFFVDNTTNWGEEDFYVSGPIIGPLAGAAGIIKDGREYMYLEGANTYNGPTLVKRGGLYVDDPGAFGSSPLVTVQGGGLIYDGYGNFTNATPVLATGGDIDFSGQVTLTGSITLSNWTFFTGWGNSAWLNLAGTVSGPRGFSVLGGTVRLSGSSPNTFGDYILVDPTYASFYNGSNAVLELAKSPGVVSVPQYVQVEGSDTNIAILSSLQDGGVSDVRIYAGGSWMLNNHIAAPNAVTFYGPGFVDSGASGQLQFTASGVSTQLQVLPSFYYSSYTASVRGRTAFLSPTMLLDISNAMALDISAQVSGGATIQKQGDGILRLGGNNSFTGPLNLLKGVVVDDSNTGLGSRSAGTFVSDGASLAFGPNVNYCGEPITINGAGVGGTLGAIVCSNACDVTNTLTLATPSTINLPTDLGLGILEIDAQVTGTGPLTQIGGGTLSLVGVGTANNFTGEMLALNGTLQLYKDTAVPGNLVIGNRTGLGLGGTAATVRYYASSCVAGTNVTVNGGSLLNLNNNNEDLVTVNLNNGGSIQTGAGTLNFIGAIGTGTRVAVNPGRNSSSTISGNIRISFGGSFDVGAKTFPDILHPTPDLDLQAALSDSISFSLLKNGSGEMRISGANTFTSTFTINSGRVTLANGAGLGASSSGTVVNNDGILSVTGGLVINNESLTMNSSNVFALQSISGSNTWNGPIVLGQNTFVDVEPSSGYLQVLGSVSGPGGLTKTGPGILQFWGFTANSYGGLTVVSNGLIDAGRVNLTSIPGDIVLGDDVSAPYSVGLRILREQQVNPLANVTVHNSGILWLWDFPSVPSPNVVIRTLSGGGLLHIDPNSALTVSNDIPCTFDGPAESSGSLTKDGPSTMKWTSQASTYSGQSYVLAGDFLMDGLAPAMRVDVESGGYFHGDTQVSNVVVQTGGSLGVESATPGRQGGRVLVGAMRLSSSSRLLLDFFGPDSTGGNDTIAINGPTANLGNATLVPTFHYAPRSNDLLTLVSKRGFGFITNAFSGWPQGTIKTIGGIPVVINYFTNRVTFNVTNLALSYSSYRLAEGNGNQTIEPDECNLLYVSLLNHRSGSVTITNAALRSLGSGMLVTIPTASYPAIAAGAIAENITPFQIRTDTNLPCGGTEGLELTLGVANEGVFAVTFTPTAGTDCTHPTGECQGCNTVSGRFTINTPVTTQPLLMSEGPSLCLPPKACPGVDPSTNLAPVPYLTHSFTNSTTNDLCVTAQLNFTCPSAPYDGISAAAYLGSFDANQPCNGYIGDTGTGGAPPSFSFLVPAGSNVTVVVMSRATNLVCDTYALELFGLPCGLPTLAISHETVPGKVRVDWSTAFPGFTPQQAPAPGGTFNNMAQSPSIVGGRYAVTNLPAATGNQFYRLKK